jgi:TrmH family RNA methyltransferase
MLTTRIRAIQSRQNSRVKELRAAFQRPGRNEGKIGIEGGKLLLEALRSGLNPETVFIAAGFEEHLEGLLLADHTEILSLPPDVFTSVVSTESPQPVAAILQAPVSTLPSVLGDALAVPLVVLIAGLQDPGNLGTLIRSAEAFGATGMVLLPGTTSPWNAKALRASAGSVFRLPVATCNAEEAFSFLQDAGVRTFAAVVQDKAGAAGVNDLRGPVALLIGNEGSGLSQELIAMADAPITIPCPGMTESLNAAVAGSILLYEASRQRRLK